MKNKFRNHFITFKVLAYFLSFFLKNCTDYEEDHKIAASAPEIVDHVRNTLSSFPEIPTEKKIETCVDLVENFLLTFCGKRGLQVSSPSILRMCAKEGVEKVGKNLQEIIHPSKVKDLPAFPGTFRSARKTPVQGGGALRKRWKDTKGRIYEWDNQENHIEIYNKTGKQHLGAFDPITGAKIKDGIPGRSVSP